jgi:outer membrane lipoprotein SlyB
MKQLAVIFLSLALVPIVPVRAVDSDAVLGGAVGGGLGAAIGSEVGGREGAIAGGAIGAAVGTAIATKDDEHETRERVIYRDRVIYVDDGHHHGPPGHAHGHRIPPGHAKHRHRHKHKHH